MAGLFCCSGDHFETASALQKWQAGSGLIVPAGKHGKGLSGTWAKSLATIRSTRCVMGLWFRNGISMGPTSHDGSEHACSVQSAGDGKFIFAYFSGPFHYTAVDLWRPNTWHWLELDVVLDPTAGGTVLVYLDDPLHLSPVLDLSGIITAPGGAREPYYWNGVKVGSTGVFDDLYVLDGATTDVYGNTGAPVDPLGPIRIDVVRPMDEGFVADFTPSPAVPNWQNADDDSPDGTTVNAAGLADVGVEDLHEMEDISTGDTAIFQHILCSAKKSDEGVGQLTMLARHDGATYDLETRDLALDWIYRTRVMLHTMPNGDPLTDANFNAQQAGYRREA